MNGDQVIYLMQERVGDAQWQTLFYATGNDWKSAVCWSKVDPHTLAVDGFPVYRRLVSTPPWSARYGNIGKDE